MVCTVGPNCSDCTFQLDFMYCLLHEMHALFSMDLVMHLTTIPPFSLTTTALLPSPLPYHLSQLISHSRPQSTHIHPNPVAHHPLITTPAPAPASQPPLQTRGKNDKAPKTHMRLHYHRQSFTHNLTCLATRRAVPSHAASRRPAPLPSLPFAFTLLHVCLPV